jgi:hypothetical protein
MPTSLAHDATHDDWIESRHLPGRDPVNRAQWLLWTLFGLALLGAFLLFIIDDYALRNLISVQ